MKLKRIREVLVFTALALLMILPFSCASKPPVEEEVIVEEEVVATMDMVNEALTGVQAARERAVKAKAPKAVPEMFEAGENLVASADKAKEQADLNQAFGDYTAAVKAYDKAAGKANELREEALKAMKAADQAISNAEKNAEEAAEQEGGES